MAERSLTKPEIASQKITIKLPPAIGDWTTYHPPKVLVKKIKSGLYGFDRLSKKELNTFLLIHYHFVEALFKRLKVDLSLGIEFASAQVEQTTYLNFLRTLNGPVVQGKFIIEGIHEGVQVFFDINWVNSLINHALGCRDLEPLNRALTEAESAVLSTTLTEYLPLYTAAFEAVIKDPTFNIVSSPDVTLDPSINTSSTFVCFSAEVSLNENPFGKISFGYLGSAAKKLVSQYMEKAQNKKIDFSRLPSVALNKIMIPISAVLGKTFLLTSDLHNLEKGDVVSIDTPTKDPLSLLIGSFLKCPAQPGINNNKNALRIAGFDEEEDVKISPPITVTEEKVPLPEVNPEAENAAPAETEINLEDLPEKEEEKDEDIFDESIFEEEEEFPAELLEDEEENVLGEDNPEKETEDEKEEEKEA